MVTLVAQRYLKFLAGLATGVWRTAAELHQAWHRDRLFEPTMSPAAREERFAAWQRHVAAAREA